MCRSRGRHRNLSLPRGGALSSYPFVSTDLTYAAGSQQPGDDNSLFGCRHFVAACALLVDIMLCRTSRSAAIPQGANMRTRTSLFRRRAIQAITSIATFTLTAGISCADPFFFSTGNPDGLIATASRPASAGKFEIESADDFVLTSPTTLTSATFVGLLTGGATMGEMRMDSAASFPRIRMSGAPLVRRRSRPRRCPHA